MGAGIAVPLQKRKIPQVLKTRLSLLRRWPLRPTLPCIPPIRQVTPVAIYSDIELYTV